MKKKKEQNPNRIGTVKFLAWQSRGAAMGAQLMMLAYVMLYCTNYMGMTPALVGTVLMASKIFDGVSDLAAGYLVDRTNTKIGRGRPYELAVIGVWITTWLMFTIPDGSMTVKTIWLFCMYTLNQSIFATLLNANNNVYMVRAFHNEEKYVKLNSFGGIIVSLVAVAVNIMLPITIGQMATSASGWSKMIAYYCVPLGILSIMRFIFVKEENVDDVKSEPIKMKDVFTVLKSNRYIYIIAFLLLGTNFITNMGVSSYYFTYVVGNIQIMSITGLLGLVVLVSMLFYPTILKKISVKSLIQIGCLIYAAGALLMFFAKGNVPLIVLSSLITGCAALPISYMNYQMVLDCATYNEWNGHEQMVATMSSITNFAMKLGSALGSFLLGNMLTLAGFISNADATVQVTQPDSTVLMIRLLFSLIPMAFYLILAAILHFYDLDARMPQIKADIKDRKEQAGK